MALLFFQFKYTAGVKDLGFLRHYFSKKVPKLIGEAVENKEKPFRDPVLRDTAS
jgi:hypothetical protein